MEYQVRFQTEVLLIPHEKGVLESDILNEVESTCLRMLRLLRIMPNTTPLEAVGSRRRSQPGSDDQVPAVRPSTAVLRRPPQRVPAEGQNVPLVRGVPGLPQ